MQIESVLQTKNRSEQAKNRFSVALLHTFKGDNHIRHKKMILAQGVLQIFCSHGPF